MHTEKIVLPASVRPAQTRSSVFKSNRVWPGFVSGLVMLASLIITPVHAQSYSSSETLGYSSDADPAPPTPPGVRVVPTPASDGLEQAWLEYELAEAEYELALSDYAQAESDYEAALADYESILGQMGNVPVDEYSDDEKKAVDEAKKIIDERKAQLKQAEDTKAEKEKRVADALRKVLETAAKDPKAKVKGGILVFGVPQGGNTVIRININSGFDPNTVVTVTINTPGKPTTVTIKLDKDGKGTADITVNGLLAGGLYTAQATGTLAGKPQTGNYDGIPVINPPR